MKTPSINTTKAKQTAFKLVAGVALVASSYAGIFNVVDKYTNLPELATKIATAVIVAVLACTLAQNSTPTKKK